MPILCLKQPILQDSEGVAHPDALYKASSVLMDLDDSQGSVLWRAYHDQAALLSGKQPLSGCDHNTHITPADFGRVFGFAPPAGAVTYGAQTSSALVFVAQTVGDTDGGQKDAQGQPVLEPFFKAAQVVQIG